MLVLGLMSGTSADGIDVALCDIQGQPSPLHARIIAGKTYPYDATLRQRILDNCDMQTSQVDQIAQLNVDIANIFADAIFTFCAEQAIDLAKIDLIGSHGQTLWHNVLPDGSVSASLQIGEASVLAERTGITTISNMRARDIAAGGQGAPLTGYIDWLLLRHETYWRAIQNIGGMGNVTFLPPLNDDTHEPIAFDTGPGNALLDTAVAHFTNGEQTYDRDGQLANQGQISEEWLDELLQHPYYQRGYPKTTGREMFGTEAAMALIDQAEQRGLSQYDIIATLTALTATNIGDAYSRFAPGPIEEVILGGGGQHNPYMVKLIETFVAPAVVRTHEDIGISSDFKEALVFAVLAYETWHGRPGTLPSLTGAHHAAILGQITPGANYEALLQQRQQQSQTHV
ncbi:anhydro-N-acetylmuramic acid kinase [Phototrophicus methaneseepsis]|uniref:Anhydro-N-acetylmuramic acid kinase n=1 Tax=Phototrophicus methaneseepsis TaxID=2710758 RepID=A0A7S8E5B7_9CHLR|nr:anhydro-N-acetylmuramic acid kinase [Phototrophicus methaneseepsis]QPC80647.1 anhydro-N-acetylmuramic acid kinase [Phototrophicus methaneseepsis]